MLVLTRKEGEAIVIGNDVRVSVVSVGPGRVKLAIDAPKWMAIDRQEIHDRKQREALGEPAETESALHNRISETIDALSGGPRKSR
jgi:carbon storage regulator